jgi:NhaP-type Na+/H+ or K+/H+ antiporter
MRWHAPDALSLGIGLAVIAVGAAGLAGSLDFRTLDRGWLLPAIVAAAGAALVAAAVRRRR